MAAPCHQAAPGPQDLAQAPGAEAPCRRAAILRVQGLPPGGGAAGTSWAWTRWGAAGPPGPGSSERARVPAGGRLPAARAPCPAGADGGPPGVRPSTGGGDGESTSGAALAPCPEGADGDGPSRRGGPGRGGPSGGGDRESTSGAAVSRGPRHPPGGPGAGEPGPRAAGSPRAPEM